MGREQVLINATELGARLNAGEELVILDVRWQLTEPDGHFAYRQGHIPGAVYVSLDDDLSDRSAVGRGRHPLPSGRAVEAAARRWGVRQHTPVVVYDDWNRAGSARAWWVLTAAGIPDVRVLDGGLAAWIAARGVLETGVVLATHGDVVVGHHDLYAGARATVTAEQAAGTARLFDARAPERFRGDGESVDPVAGHIPGAVNLPSAAVFGADGRFLDGAEVVGLLLDRGWDGSAPPAVYCGSGVTAAVTVAALTAAGVDAALYPGSWSEWVSDPRRPVERGG